MTQATLYIGLNISIHAPPRGATYDDGTRVLKSYLFQFTPLREGRPRSPVKNRRFPYFNSRPSARGDHVRGEAYTIIKAFQFTPLREGRLNPPPPRAAAPLFQFTPLREGRQHLQLAKNISGKFQFTPLREGRRHRVRHDTCENRFQFTPLREGRQLLQGSVRQPYYFNSRPSARGDAPCTLYILGNIHFNSRPSARGDGKRYAISANLLFNPYKSAWLNNSATQFVEIILVIFHRIIA